MIKRRMAKDLSCEPPRICPKKPDLDGKTCFGAALGAALAHMFMRRAPLHSSHKAALAKVDKIFPFLLTPAKERNLINHIAHPGAHLIDEDPLSHGCPRHS